MERGGHERGAKAFLCPGYAEIPNRTLQQYRRDHLDDKTMRPLEKYERQLRDEHVLVDTVRMRSAALLCQQGQVQRAIDAQTALEAQATAEQQGKPVLVVSPTVGAELERLVRLADSYDQALYRLGLLQTGNGRGRADRNARAAADDQRVRNHQCQFGRAWTNRCARNCLRCSEN